MSVEKLAAVWPEWKVVEQIGEGSFGKVYKVVRSELSVTTYAAVKVISIPQNDAEINSLRAEGMDNDATKAYLQGIVNDFITEVKLLETLKGTSNIVSVEDFRVVEQKNRIGWDIFIRMELLTPFTDYVADRQMSEQEVIKLGIDMCTALELCAQRKIIHRDIKPENIFVSSFGDYKIGDFGIAKELEKTSGALSSKGTYNYMAPEVATGKKYDATVDIYSLGLVLYKLLNNNRLPFIDPYAQQIQYQERKNAVDRRLRGEVIPAPVNASEQMASIVLAACAYSPEGRFETPTAMKKALITLGEMQRMNLSTTGFSYTAVGTVNSTALNTATGTAVKAEKTQKDSTVINTVSKTQNGTVRTAEVKKKKGSKLKIIIPLILVFAVLCVAGYGAMTYIYPATKAVECFEAGDYEGARDYLQRVSADNIILIKGLNEHLDNVRSVCLEGSLKYEDAMAQLKAVEELNIADLKEKAVAVKAELEALQDEKLSQEILEAMNKKKYDEALELYGQLITVKEGLTEELRGRIDSLYKEFEGGKISYVDAYAELDTLSAMDIPELEGEITSVKEKLDKLNNSHEAYEIAEEFRQRGDYKSAVEHYRKVSENDPNYTAAMKNLEEAIAAYRLELFEKADAFIEQGDYVSAFECLKDGFELIEDDAEIKDKLSEYCLAFEELKLQEADALIENKDYDGAAELLEKALELLPDSEALKEKLEGIDSLRPSELNKLVVVDSKNYSYKAEEFTDSFGNSYSDCYLFDSSYDTSYAVYNLDEQFSIFKGSLVVSQDTSSESSFNISIYVDDVLIEEITDFRRASTKIDFDIDVAQCKKLEIRIEACETDYSRIAVVDAAVIK